MNVHPLYTATVEGVRIRVLEGKKKKTLLEKLAETGKMHKMLYTDFGLKAPLREEKTI